MLPGRLNVPGRLPAAAGISEQNSRPQAAAVIGCHLLIGVSWFVTPAPPHQPALRSAGFSRMTRGRAQLFLRTESQPQKFSRRPRRNALPFPGVLTDNGSSKERIPAMTRTIAAMAALFLAGQTGAGFAAEYQVRMLNQSMNGMMQYDPQLLKISPGDTVHFIATDQGHNVQSIEGMIPSGAKPFSGTVGENLTVTFTVPGVYV